MVTDLREDEERKGDSWQWKDISGDKAPIQQPSSSKETHDLIEDCPVMRLLIETLGNYSSHFSQNEILGIVYGRSDSALRDAFSDG